LFQSILPTIGPGALRARTDESVLYGTENEKQLYLPSDKFWKDIAEECAQEGIGVSIFLGNSKHIDTASIGMLRIILTAERLLISFWIGVVCSMTGGEMFFHPRFNPVHDATVLESQLRRLLTRTTVYNCMMRIRCSQGLVTFLPRLSRIHFLIQNLRS
jgi:protein transport protein SEC24